MLPYQKTITRQEKEKTRNDGAYCQLPADRAGADLLGRRQGSAKISPSSLKDRAAGLRTGSSANTSMIFLSFCSASQALSRLSRLRFNFGQVSSHMFKKTYL
jgi:hypothetical protein